MPWYPDKLDYQSLQHGAELLLMTFRKLNIQTYSKGPRERLINQFNVMSRIFIRWQLVLDRLCFFEFRSISIILPAIIAIIDSITIKMVIISKRTITDNNSRNHMLPVTYACQHTIHY
jgi:hypothetical protein